MLSIFAPLPPLIWNPAVLQKIVWGEAAVTTSLAPKVMLEVSVVGPVSTNVLPAPGLAVKAAAKVV